jgi:hypothetical protein
VVATFGETDAIQPMFRASPRLSDRQPAHLGKPQHHVSEGSQVWKKVIALEHHADARPLTRQRATGEATALAAAAAISERLPVELDFAAVEFLQQIDAAEKCCLAGAARPDDRDDIRFKDIKIDSTQHDLGTEVLDQSFDAENRIQFEDS